MERACSALRDWRPPSGSVRAQERLSETPLALSIDSTKQQAVEHNKWATYNQHCCWWQTKAFLADVRDSFVPRLVILFVVYCTMVVACDWLAGGMSLDVEVDVTAGLSMLMALLLAFRINISYSRWWEGCTLWGGVAMSSRSIVTSTIIACESTEGDALDESLTSRCTDIIGWLIAFANLLRTHLRREKPESALEGEHVRRIIDSDALARVSLSNHPPLAALRQIRLASMRFCAARRKLGHEVCHNSMPAHDVMNCTLS